MSKKPTQQTPSKKTRTITTNALSATASLQRTRLIGASVVLLLLILAAYSNHWHNSFHFDDYHTIENNAYIRSLTNIPSFFTNTETFSSLPGHGSYRPMVSLTLAIDYWLAQTFSGDGFHTSWYHLDTFVFFLLQGVLMFFFFRKILDNLAAPNRIAWIAFAATAFYMVHPVLAETINYIIARSDSLSTCFMVMAFVVYQYSPKARKYFLYFIPLLIGAFAKPTALMFAPMLLVYHLLFEQKVSLFSPKSIGWRTLMKTVMPVFLFEAIVYVFMKRMEAHTFDPGGYSLYHYLITQPLVVGRYVGQFFLPTSLSADTDWQPFQSILDPSCIAGFLFLIVFAGLGLLASRTPNWRPVSFGIAFFLLALIPTTVVPLAEVTNDHRVFFPYVGLAIALVWTLYLLIQPRLVKIPAAALFLIGVLLCSGFAFGTYQRNIVWYSEESLWKDVTEKSPHNGRGMMNYGLIFMARGSYDTANFYYTLGLRSAPNYSVLHCNMGVLQSAMGHPDLADSFFQRGILLEPENPEIYHFYGVSLHKYGRNAVAIQNFYKSLKLSESNLEVRHALMEVLYDRSRFEELKQVADRTLQIVPGDQQAIHFATLAAAGKSALQLAAESAATLKTPEAYLDLSLRYYQARQFQNSIDAARTALSLRPDYAEAYNNICAAYNELGNFAEGKKAGEEAVRLKPEDPLAKGNLAWSLRGLMKR